MKKVEVLNIKYKPDNEGVCHIERLSNVYFSLEYNKLKVVHQEIKGVRLSSYIINFYEVRSIDYIENS